MYADKLSEQSNIHITSSVLLLNLVMLSNTLCICITKLKYYNI